MLSNAAGKITQLQLKHSISIHLKNGFYKSLNFQIQVFVELRNLLFSYYCTAGNFLLCLCGRLFTTVQVVMFCLTEFLFKTNGDCLIPANYCHFIEQGPFLKRQQLLLNWKCQNVYGNFCFNELTISSVYNLICPGVDTPFICLNGEAPPERRTFFGFQVYKREGIYQFKDMTRKGKIVTLVCKKAKKGQTEAFYYP